MRPYKHLATFLSLLVSVPVIAFCIGYLQLSCSEYEPCDTGGWMPHAGVAAFIAASTAMLEGALIIHLWRSDPDHDA